MIVSQGTRQKSSRNFGIRLAPTTLDIFKVGGKSEIEERKNKLETEQRIKLEKLIHALHPLNIRKVSKVVGAAAKDSLPTVYQKHSSMRTRKRMYRG